jgi:hypothetical protein
MCETRQWTPLLPGSSEVEAFTVISNIAADILSFDLNFRWYDELQYPRSLGFGDAGLAICFGYIASSLPGASHARAAALQYMDAASTALKDEWMPCEFIRGGAGICWASSHIRELFSGSTGDSWCTEYVDLLLEWCRTEDTELTFFDGISGMASLVGACHDQSREELVFRTFASRLLKSADSVEHGTAWPASSEADKNIRERFGGIGPSSKVYLPGVGSGIGGIVGSLLMAKARRGLPPALDKVLIGGVEWLLNSRLRSDSFGSFPVFAGSMVPGPIVGTLRILIVLLNAGILYEREDWRASAVSGAARIAEWSLNKSSKFFGLYSGSAAFAHLFNRFFHATVNELFAVAARHWYSQLLSCRVHGKGIGGYLLREAPVMGLLFGASGVALTLLAAISHTAPNWDQALLWSLPAVEFSTSA